MNGGGKEDNMSKIKYDLQAINIYSNGSISIDYRKLDEQGKYLGSVGNDSNIPKEAKIAIYESIRNIEKILNETN